MIDYPEKISEAEIQAELWHRLKAMNIDARLQVNQRIGGRNPRLDIVIFKDYIAICIIECKSWSKSYIRNRKYQQAKNTKQILKYKQYFNLPVLICGCTNAIAPVSKIVESIYAKA